MQTVQPQGCTNYAETRGKASTHTMQSCRVLIKLEKEESIWGMGQLIKDAAMEDATTTNWKEESALGTWQTIKDAPMEDATTMQQKKESAWGMG